MTSHGHTWAQSVHPMHRGRSIEHNCMTWLCSCPGSVSIQSTGQTDTHASQHGAQVFV